MKKIYSLAAIRDAYAQRDEPERFVYVARVSWMLMLCVSVLALIASVAFGTWQFFAPSQPIVVGKSAEIISFNRAQLHSFVEIFETRKSNFETMMSE